MQNIFNSIWTEIASLWDLFKTTWTHEIIAILLFLFIVEFAVRVWRYLRDRWEARKYDISGDYISFYEDEQDKKSVNRYSRLRLKQRGTKLFGQDVTRYGSERTERTWRLEGKLVAGHLIVGSYTEPRRGSDSIGAFFVKRENGSQDFKGSWSGWDQDNFRLNTGRYSFYRRPDFNIIEAMDNDKAAIAELSEFAFGRNYFEVGVETKRALYGESSVLVAKDTHSDRVVGFCFFYMLPKDGLKEFIRGGKLAPKSATPTGSPKADEADSIEGAETTLPDFLTVSDREGKIGMIQTVAVDEKMRRRGIGVDLLLEAEQRLLRSSPMVILLPAWKVDGRVNAGNLFEISGYTGVLSVPHYWRHDCDSNKFKCSHRADNKCNCEMVVFRKSVPARPA